MEQLPDAGIVPFDSASELPPLVMVTVPPQVLDEGVAAVLIIPGGYVSVKAAPLTNVVLGLVSVMVMLVAPLIGMVLTLKLLAAVGAKRAAWMGTAPIVQLLDLLIVHDIVAVPPVANSVLPEPFAYPLLLVAAGFHRTVWPVPTVQVRPPLVVMVSITISPATVVALTEGFLLLPLAETKVPSGLLRFTPVNDVAPAVIEAVLDTLTVMVLVPPAGESRYHISV
jgi:hypothetical protein